MIWLLKDPFLQTGVLFYRELYFDTRFHEDDDVSVRVRGLNT